MYSALGIDCNNTKHVQCRKTMKILTVLVEMSDSYTTWWIWWF